MSLHKSYKQAQLGCRWQGKAGRTEALLALSKPFCWTSYQVRLGESGQETPQPLPHQAMDSFSFSLSVLRWEQGIRGFCSKVSHSPLLNENNFT